MGTLRDTGEFGLIERLSRTLGPQPSLIAGIGDDAAIWNQPAAGMVATTDMLVEQIHFDFALTSWRDLGWKALAVNLSDVAAMGAAPVLALVSLGLRPDTGAADVEALYEGMRELASQSGCAIAGGDTVSSPTGTVLNVAVLGAVPADEADTLLRRDVGQPGDVVAVTGVLGASAAGLHVLQCGDGDDPTLAPLLDAHRRPQPRLASARALRHAGVRCAMDVSDGLVADLGKLCRASGCGAEISADRLPTHALVRERFPERSLAWTAAGGEDYELLVALPAHLLSQAQEASARAGSELTAIGSLVQGQTVRLLDASGQEVRLPTSGWDHFGPAAGSVPS